MPPSICSGVVPSATSLTPTSENRGIPQRKVPSYTTTSHSSHAKPSKGSNERVRLLRPLTVNEALQYSSLSSIVPFDSGIPIPTSEIPLAQPIFSTPSAVWQGRQSLAELDASLSQIGDLAEASQRALQTLGLSADVNNLPELKFKIPRGLKNRHSHLACPLEAKRYPGISKRLGPYANLVLNNMDVSFRYPTPDSPGIITIEKGSPPKSEPPKLPIIQQIPQWQQRNTAAYTYNAAISQNEYTQPVPVHVKSQPEVLIQPLALTSDRSFQTSTHVQYTQVQPMVVIPPLPQSSSSNDYRIYPTHDVGKHSKSVGSKKRMREDGVSIELVSLNKDQRALSDAALAEANSLISDILDIENDIPANGDVTAHSNRDAYFAAHEGGDGPSLTLTPAANVKLEASLQKVISLGRFTDISADRLCRIQTLCEGALEAAENVELSIQSGWSDGDISDWLEKVNTMYGCLRSARTVLCIMTGGREEKQIYSEELLRKVLTLLYRVMDTCIVPVVESRTSDPESSIFDVGSSHKKAVSQLLHSAGKLMFFLLELLTKVEVAEDTVTSIEFFVIRLLFAENAYSEKESVLGIQKFESFRRITMSTIAEIFSRYPEQRRFIIDEILISLQKLPVNRQHARQYKLDDGTSVQLVSALLMRLIHSSAMRSTSKSFRRAKRVLPEVSDSAGGDRDSSDGDGSQSSMSERTSETQSDASDLSLPSKLDKKVASVPYHLIRDVKSLYDSAVSNAQYIVEFFVNRASTASKTGDQPHRHLLDMFVGDLIAVLHSPDWPSSELLLRALISKMDRIANTDKSPAPAKNMALEILGLAGSAISDVTTGARQLARALENDDSALSTELTQSLEDHVMGHLEDRKLLSWTRPYRAVVEHLSTSSSETHIVGARGFYITQWTKLLLWGGRPTSHETDIDSTQLKLANQLGRLVRTGKWIIAGDFDEVTSTQCRLAYMLTILNMGFCRAFGQILQTLLKAVRSDQITVRTRSLKSVTQMLEKDPTLLERMPQVIRLILNCALDQSPMVRDSSLALIGKCIVLKPALETEVLDSILGLTNDAAIGIRKRAVKLLKDIYLRNTNHKVRTEIVDNLLQRVEDIDNSVADFAIQTFEDIWLIPFWTLVNNQDASAKDRITLKDQVALIINTVQHSDKVLQVLQILLSRMLIEGSKNLEANSKVCKAMVSTAFEGLIDTTELPGRPSQRIILQTLTVFSRASPKLFTQQQLEQLQPYITNLVTADDLNIFRSVVVILRCVLPTLSAIQKGFLRQIQEDLMRNITKLAKAELNEVVACLWTINEDLGNIEKLVKLEVGVLNKLHSLRIVDFSDAGQQQELSKLKRFILLASHFAKHCNFEPHAQNFSSALAWWAGSSVAECVIDSIRPFSECHQPLGLRSIAFDGIGMICQAWPRNFNRPEIASTFQKVLQDDAPELQRIVLSNFRDFFAAQDQQVGAKVSSSEKDPLAHGTLGGSMTASDNDGAAALIAQGFLKDVLRIALSSQDTYALTATEVVASITRQGLVHPKECGPALVALETSTNPRIAEIAVQQHRNLHQQHESMFEREYMRAIHEAYIYQRDVVQDFKGFITVQSSYRSKLHHMYEVIKTSKSKYQGKFLDNFCARIDFDITKLDTSSTPPVHLQYAVFLIQNLAFYDYGRVEDVLHAISSVEKIVTGTGAGVAHAINTEVFHVRLEPAANFVDGPEEAASIPIEANAAQQHVQQDRLRQLTTASMILSIMWEARTYVRRLYGINSNQQKREGKAKGSKDLTKAPTKTNGISGDKLVDAIARISRSLDSTELSFAQCKEFADLLAIDNEVKVAVEAEDGDEGRLKTPSEEDGDSTVPPSGESRSIKRKGSASIGGTPHKKKRGRPPLPDRRKSTKSVDDDDDDSY